MNFKSIIGAACTCLAVVSFNADAALEPRLGGLAYYDPVGSGYDQLAVPNQKDSSLSKNSCHDI